MPRPLLTVEQLTPAQHDVLRRFFHAGDSDQFDPIVLGELRELGVLQYDDGVDELTPPGRALQWSLSNGVRLPPIEN